MDAPTPPIARKAANRASRAPYRWRQPRSDTAHGSSHKDGKDSKCPNLAKWRHAVAYFNLVAGALLAVNKSLQRESMAGTAVVDDA